MAKVAHLSIPVTSGLGVVLEKFTWTFSDRGDDNSEYVPGVITNAFMDVNPNTSGVLRLTSVYYDGTEEVVEKAYSVGDAPVDPPKAPSQLGEFTLTWHEADDLSHGS